MLSGMLWRQTHTWSARVELGSGPIPLVVPVTGLAPEPQLTEKMGQNSKPAHSTYSVWGGGSERKCCGLTQGSGTKTPTFRAIPRPWGCWTLSQPQGLWASPPLSRGRFPLLANQAGLQRGKEGSSLGLNGHGNPGTRAGTGRTHELLGSPWETTFLDLLPSSQFFLCSN